MTRLPRLRSPSLPLLLSLPALLLPLHAEAGSISVTEGNVMSLDDATQVASVAGAALFDEALSGDIPLDLYADQGLTMHVGLFTDIIADVPITGMANPPIYVSVGDRFPAPIAGGGIANQGIIFYGGALTFDVRTYQDFDEMDQTGPINGGEVDPDAFIFEPGEEREIVLVRVFYEWQIITPVIGNYGGFANLSGNKRLLASSVAFRNEPFGEIEIGG